jgi:hypothetical protein
MNQHDIEELLQQYGEDQRQQQHAAGHVRHLAQRQARRRTALACVAVMAAIVGTMLHRWQALPEPVGILIAEQPADIDTKDNTLPPSIAPEVSPTVSATPRNAKLQPIAIQSDHSDYYSDNFDYSDHSDFSDYSDHSDYSNPPSIAPPTPIQLEPLQPAQPPQSTPKPSRLHLIVSLGVSTMSNVSFGMGKETGLNSLDAPNYTSITPTQNLSANVGVAYTIAYNNHRHLDVGVTLSGYAEQCNLHIHEAGYTYVNGIDGFGVSSYENNGTTAIPNNTDLHYTFNTLSLYAGVPLTLNLHPRGSDRMGWQLSLTPAHSLIPVGKLGNMPTLNPWRLTMGIGIAIPESVIRHINLTANLLPTYTSQSLYEFGIEIGL